jgi:glycosyltransferase involved in cell wall biosynthesis
VRIQKEADALARNGYTVTLVVWDRGRNPPPRDPGAVHLERLFLPVPQDSMIVALLLPVWWIYVFGKVLSLQAEVVQAADFDSYFPALIGSRITGKIIFYDIFDFYADMMRFPVFPRLTRWIINGIDRRFMRYADLIILPDASRKSQIRCNPCPPVTIITNSPDERVLDGLAPQGRPASFTIFYGGVLNDDRYIDRMCAIVRELPDVSLVIRGPCSLQYAETLHAITGTAPNISLQLQWVSYSEIIQGTLQSDMLFALYDPGIEGNRYASPNKLFESMLCGKPILVSGATSMAGIVEEEQCGIVVPFGDAEKVKEAILRLKNDPGLAQTLGRNGKNAYRKSYSWAIMEKRLVEAYQRFGVVA